MNIIRNMTFKSYYDLLFTWLYKRHLIMHFFVVPLPGTLRKTESWVSK